MSSPAYTDPRLAAVYDTLNPFDAVDRFYAGFLGPAPGNVLEIGCGTGRLACYLAGQGHRVTGVDPAAGMLGIARARPGGEAVRWIMSEAAALDHDETFDALIMTGHVFQVFLDDADVRAVLAVCRRHLSPGGQLMFETRNPLAREWEDWTPAKTATRLNVPGVGPVDVHYDVTSVDGERVTYGTRFDFGAGDVVHAQDTLRFMGQAQLAAMLANAEFADVTWCGDWDGSAFAAASPEIIAIAC